MCLLNLQVGIDMVSSDGELVVHGGGNRVKFLGYLSIYDDSGFTADEAQLTGEADALDGESLSASESSVQGSRSMLSRDNPGVEAILQLKVNRVNCLVGAERVTLCLNLLPITEGGLYLLLSRQSSSLSSVQSI